jgi:hypothetical protein
MTFWECQIPTLSGGTLLPATFALEQSSDLKYCILFEGGRLSLRIHRALYLLSASSTSL